MKYELKILRTLFVTIFLLISSPAIAGYLNVINSELLPQDAVDKLSQLRKLEPYVEEWQPTWSHEFPKEGIKAQINELYDGTENLLSKDPNNGELLLLYGLIAFYGHNVDIEHFTERADANFKLAQKALPDDYRPMWFLGMHLTKSTRYVEGMKVLLEAERKQSISEPLFWEDYAASAYLTTMFSHSLQALDKVRELSGKKSRLDAIIGDRIREAAKIPKPGEKMRAQDLWQSNKTEMGSEIISFPFGYKFFVMKGDRDFQTTNFDGRFAALQIGLTPRIGSGGVKRIPTFQFMTFIADGNETLESFTKRFLSKTAKWQSYDANLGLGEVAYIGESSDYYKDDGGAKVVMITFEKTSPKISRFAIEEPNDELKDVKGENPSFFRLTRYYQRFEERLFYQIWLETPIRFFDDSLVEFKDILKTLIVE